ncbi:amidohydrolase [Amycolatopsis sp. H20-H5]|uniref:amidohydrolase n=1 Tax=Amycolatopsis sp. H20-H5 TaxID=3046309 RepID=UPI002DB84BF3|nr:amidohydrolase [Amycolatopsis sp. H20-H5]
MALTAAPGLLAGCSDNTSYPADSGERLLLDNVRGYTIAGGQLRRFGSLLVGSDGRVVALDPGNVAGARRIDGHGRTCLPGLHDAHGHIWDFGAAADELDLSGTWSLEEALGALGRYAADHRDQQWIVGTGWNEGAWRLGRLPVAADLDQVVPDRPVWLERVDGHAGVANTAGLRAAGITDETEAPAGGQVMVGSDSEPTGVLVDTAMSLVQDQLPTATAEDHRRHVRAAQRKLNSRGLTSVSDAQTEADELAVAHQEAAAGTLSVRLNVFLSWDAFTQIGTEVRTDSAARDLVRVRTVKLYIDGALGSRGASLWQPYSDAPGTRGLPRMSQDELNDRVRRVVEAGYQCAVHAIGDQGNAMVLDAYQQALPANRASQWRHRVEHAQIMAVSDIPRLAQLGLIASMQPTHATDDMTMAESRLGRDRIAGAYAWRSFLRHGAVIAAGSDFPVSTENPFDGMHAAVTRTSRDGKPLGGWYPAETMTPVEALRAYTLDAAYAAHQESVLGSLEPGKWADFILVDQDPFALPSGRALWQTGVLQTWVAGKRVGDYGQL